jgi:hypothetical protein
VVGQRGIAMRKENSVVTRSAAGKLSGARPDGSAAANAAGYSGTPLAKKLGIKEAHSVLLIAAPNDYVQLLSPVPAAVQFVCRADKTTDLVQLFVTRREVLASQLSALRKALKADAAIWVSWPKKSAKIETTVSEDTIRELALPLGLVDIKVCAVDEVWSGLKLVVRKALR